MPPKQLRIAATGGILIACCLAALLSMPVESWRTGRNPVPPLDLVSGGPQVSMPSRVWIDTDAACGAAPTVDSDDCLAILYLAQHPGIEIIGISTVAGNAPLQQTDRTVRELVGQLAASGHEQIPVFRGGDHLGSDAARALHNALSEPLTIAALGPLTNIATALSRDPSRARQVARLVAVMGRRKGHLFHPAEGSGRGMLLGHGPVFSDFNVAKDPEATTAVLKMSLPITLIPYDAARLLEIGASDLDRLAATGGAAAWVARRSRGWLGYWNDDIGRSGFYPFDLLAAAYVTEADRFDCARTHIWAAPGGDLFPPFYSPVSVIVGRAHEAPEDPLTSGRGIYCTRVHPDLHRILLDGLTAARLVHTPIMKSGRSFRSGVAGGH